ncbi:hypothetical protein VNO77_37317 [Canavalia gladiata]|uniref:Uncharacterized protein n=1 Tax=Canavalia gladiata TaxID=3824 RepID=A0AAN9K838_CANGL
MYSTAGCQIVDPKPVPQLGTRRGALDGCKALDFFAHVVDASNNSRIAGPTPSRSPRHVGDAASGHPSSSTKTSSP